MFTFGLNIVGDTEDGRRVWKVNGKALTNGHSLRLVPGQMVRFSVAQGGHGLLFPDEATAKAIFDIDGSPRGEQSFVVWQRPLLDARFFSAGK